jgi:glycosyltransferase involved in cell wall biosynthesis
MTKTIWYISKYIAPPYAARVSTRGFNLLKQFVNAGHRSVLITSDSTHVAEPPRFVGRIHYEIVDGVDVHWLRTWKYRSARSFNRILSWIDFEVKLLRMPKDSLPKPDFIIVSSLSLLTVLNGILLRRRMGCKIVFEVRDIWPMVLTEIGGFKSWNPLVALLSYVERIAYKEYDLIVGTMPNLIEHVEETTGASRPVVCIPHGLDPNLLVEPDPIPENYADQFFPSGKFIICHAGSIGADNALETLLTAAHNLQNHDDIQFVIVGEGYMKEHFQKQVSGLSNVSFAPRVPKAMVQSVLQRADLLYFAVHASRLMRFGQSLNKVIDYMFSGKPIVASFTGYESMINEAGCGTFVPAEDVDALCAEILRYAAMPESERIIIGARGRDWLLANRMYEKLAREYILYMERLDTHSH